MRQTGFIGSLVALASALAEFSICFDRSLPGRGAFVFCVRVRLSARDCGCSGRAFGKRLMAVDSIGCSRPAYFDRADFSVDRLE